MASSNDSSSLSTSSDCEDGETNSEGISDMLQDLLLSDVEVSGRELGVGSYSSVLELSYKGLKCAGKRLHRTLYDQGLAIGPEILERFGVECELLSQLRHPRMVQFLGLHFEEGCDVPILVLEFLPYALSDTIEHYGEFPKEISYSILYDVALGLHYLHTRSPVVIHRDLTANNILLTPNMTAKLSDLGMAKIINIAPAQMTRRMTVCPGTLSYMPPEALTSNPQYDTKLDCFSFGVLTTHIFCGEWPIGSEYLQPDPKNPGHLYPLTEIQRREKYLKRLGPEHPLLNLVHRCLKNLPSERPNAQEILEETKEVASRYPATYENRVELLNQLRAEGEEKEELKGEVDKLRCTLHEKEHTLETLTMSYTIELEKLREQVAKLEQTNSLKDMQLSQLQAENSRLQLLVASKRNEIELLKKREKTLSTELAMANSKLEEKAVQSLEKLKQLQVEVTKRSQERESVLERLVTTRDMFGRLCVCVWRGVTVGLCVEGVTVGLCVEGVTVGLCVEGSYCGTVCGGELLWDCVWRGVTVGLCVEGSYCGTVCGGGYCGTVCGGELLWECVEGSYCGTVCGGELLWECVWRGVTVGVCVEGSYCGTVCVWRGVTVGLCVEGSYCGTVCVWRGVTVGLCVEGSYCGTVCGGELLWDCVWRGVTVGLCVEGSYCGTVCGGGPLV